MTHAIETAVAFAVGGSVSFVLTPVAMRIAVRTGMLDRPRSWKVHEKPTPYLGGGAVLCAFAVGAAVLGDGFGTYWPILAGATLLSVVGIVDDAVDLPPLLRVGCEVAAGALLWATGLGWTLGGGDLLDGLVTIAWVLAVVNATNLLDLMDGVASSTSAAALLGAGVFAAVGGDVALAALATAMAGALCGFLRYNLARPSRVFLGDGGSMPVGFVVASVIANLPYEDGLGASALLAGTLMFGVPLLDLTFRIMLRLKRGLSLLTAGPDSLANRLQDRVGTPLAVSALAVLAQAVLAGAATLAAEQGTRSTVAVFVLCCTTGAAVAYRLQTQSAKPRRDLPREPVPDSI